VMVSFMAVLLSYILGQFGIEVGVMAQMVIAIVFSAAVGYIAIRGVNGSTVTALLINVVQLTALVIFSVLAIGYRLMSPDQTQFVHTTATSVIMPHDFMNVMFQATIAILILVGFESCTAFGAEAKNPAKDIPRAVLLALGIQGLLAY